MPRRILATDLATLTRCDREVYLNHHGDRTLRAPRSEYQRWLAKQGNLHEQVVMQDFDVQQPPYTLDNLELGAEITLDFMKKGVAMIAQGALIDGDLVGIPDLMRRVDGPSRLGSYHYRPLDVKSASSASEAHQLQVMAYCALLGAAQGVLPHGALLLRYPPDERTASELYREETVIFDDAKYNAALAEVRRLAGGDEPRPFYSGACHECAWREVCVPAMKEVKDVSLIPGLRRTAWRGLRERGIVTLGDLAAREPGDILEIKGVGEKSAQDMIRRARALAGNAIVRVGSPSIPADPVIVFDIESVPAEGLYYLFGTMISAGDGYQFEAHLAETLADEEATWKAFVRRALAQPGAIVHYGNYERMAAKKLGERYGMEAETEALLARMVDLEKAVRETAVLPLFSNSLKAVAPWIGFEWDSKVLAGDDSILEYMRWLEDGDRAHLERILHYNAEDCKATLAVLEWLRKQ